MKWVEALALGRDELAKQSGAFPGDDKIAADPKVAAEQAASILLAADRAARAANVPWDWFHPALAVLGYRTFGDKFRIDSAYAVSLLPEDATRYFWQALAGLAAEIDRQGIAVPPSGGGLVEAFFGRKDGTLALTQTASAAWPILLSARSKGEDPTWTNLWKADYPGLPGQGQQPIIPTLPDKPPFQPPLPVVPSFGGDLLVWAVGLYIAHKLITSK